MHEVESYFLIRKIPIENIAPTSGPLANRLADFREYCLTDCENIPMNRDLPFPLDANPYFSESRMTIKYLETSNILGTDYALVALKFTFFTAHSFFHFHKNLEPIDVISQYQSTYPAVLQYILDLFEGLNATYFFVAEPELDYYYSHLLRSGSTEGPWEYLWYQSIYSAELWKQCQNKEIQHPALHHTTDGKVVVRPTEAYFDFYEISNLHRLGLTQDFREQEKRAQDIQTLLNLKLPYPEIFEL